MKLFIDMDGVFVDFIGGALKWFCSDKTIEKDWPKGVWGDDKVFQHMFGVGMKEFWESLNERFWYNLDYTEDGKDFLKYVKQFEPCVLTSPAWTGATGKQHWLKKNEPDIFHDRRYLIGPAKSWCASSMAVLIDDSEANCKAFTEAGGTAILFPRPWNLFHSVKDPLAFVIRTLEEVLWLDELSAQM